MAAPLHVLMDLHNTICIGKGHNVTPTQGIVPILEMLHRVVPLSAFSSGRPDETSEEIEQLGMDAFFPAERRFSGPKSHSSPYTAMTEALGIEPNRCLLVENSSSNIALASQLGFICAAYLGAFSRAEWPERTLKMKRVGALFVIYNWEEVLPLLKAILDG